MRLLHVQVRPEEAGSVLSLAREHGAHAPISVGAGDQGTLVLAAVPNDAVGAFVAAVAERLGDAHFTVLPVGALPLQTPLEAVADSVRDVSRVSTLELVLASLQSIGSWPGLLLFSVLAGVIGAYGLTFDASYLLVAAMLINPMGAPALVAVTGIAVGDARLFGRGALRFSASLVVQSASALGVGLAYGLTVSTSQMEQVTSLSNWAVLVALAAGAAGAQSKIKSDRDSLVSGTASGFMVAAALAPPAAVLGLAVALGRTDYIGLMAFLLALQFFAISVGGWVVFRGFGVRPQEPSIGRGSPVVRNALAVVVAAATVGMVVWQAQLYPRFVRADLSRTALEIAQEAADRTRGAYLIESSARFTRRDLQRYNRDALLFEIVVASTGERPDDDVAADLRQHLRQLTGERMRDVVGFHDVTVVPGPQD
jgi:uncharacterized hydrophobic protein (TIGR00271 family)